MATPSIRQQYMDTATELQQRLEQTKQRIDTLPPDQQIVAAGAPEMQVECRTLTDLQKLVDRAFMTPVRGVTEEDLIAIAEKLSTSSDILDSIERNTTTAASVASLVAETESLFCGGNPNPAQFASLKERVQQLSNANQFPNSGIRDAIQTLQSTLGSGPRRNTPPSAPAGDNQTIRQAQDENAQASLFKDQFKDIMKDVGNKFAANDFVKAFETLLPHFREVREYVLAKTEFDSTNAGDIILTHLETLEGELEKICHAQEQKEKAVAAQQVQAQQGSNAALNEMRTALDNLDKTTDISLPVINRVKGAFDGLNAEQKGKVFEAYNVVLTTGQPPKNAITNPFKKMNIFQWPGAVGDKLKAVDKVLGSASTQATPSTPAAPVVKKAEEMRNRFNDVKNLMPTSSVRTTPNNSSLASQLGDLTAEEMAFINESLSSSDSVQGTVSPENVHPSVTVMNKLKNVLAMLQEGSNSQRVQAVTTLAGLEQTKAMFQMSGMEQRSIGDRPFYHIYHIHKNEAAEKLKDDMAYGSKAFAGTYEATTEERQRAVQRTIVELALENIEDAINFAKGELLVQALNLLEETKLAPKDQANGMENAAHLIYGDFYHSHVAARNGNSSLVDPHGAQFNGDFGRDAFRRVNLDGVDAAIKLQVIGNLRTALKAAWKV
jgi:hypothetical protein